VIKWLLKILPLRREASELLPFELGKAGEEEAIKYLKKKGLKILGKNIKIGRKEIDIVAEENDEIVFVEVKTCRNENWTYPENKVDYKKKENIRKTAHRYIKKYNVRKKYYRFDIIAITWEPEKSIHWIKNAF